MCNTLFSHVSVYEFFLLGYCDKLVKRVLEGPEDVSALTVQTIILVKTNCVCTAELFRLLVHKS